VLVGLTTGSLSEEVPAVTRVPGPVSDSTIELALFCRANLRANRMDWTSFLIRRVSEALERVDNGTYGLCLRCAEPISARRLRALPWVDLCTGCQEAKNGSNNT
jgi:RNA polymerase-binding transcription factor DksA